MLDGGTARQVGRGHPIEIGFRARHGTPRGKKKTIDTFVYVAPPLSTVRSTASQIYMVDTCKHLHGSNVCRVSIPLA